MVNDPHLQGLFGIYPLHIGEVVTDLSCTLPEAHDAVVQKGPGIPIGQVGITEPCKGQHHTQMTQCNPETHIMKGKWSELTSWYRTGVGAPPSVVAT